MEIDRSVVGTTPTSRVRWGAVVAGGAIAVGLMILLSALWLALAFGSEVEFVADDLEWFTAVTAVVALFVGGYIAGRWSGVPGTGPGIIQGLTLWALVMIASLSIGIPSVLNVLSVGRVATEVTSAGAIAEGVDTTLWASFFAMAAALVASLLGGAIGGAAAPDDIVDVRDEASDRYTADRTGSAGRHTQTHTHDEGRVVHAHAGDDVPHRHDETSSIR
jgi:hypothetical protein